jgi:hypothetical protein
MRWSRKEIPALDALELQLLPEPGSETFLKFCSKKAFASLKPKRRNEALINLVLLCFLMEQLFTRRDTETNIYCSLETQIFERF